jgi:hypothetical protein
VSDHWYKSILEAAPPAPVSVETDERPAPLPADLCPRINAHLEACGLREVEATFAGGVLSLSGQVDSLYERQLAVYYVRKFTRLACISDRIYVRTQPAKRSFGQLAVESLELLKGTAADWWAANSKAGWGLLAATALVAIVSWWNAEQAGPRVPVFPVSGNVRVDGTVPAGAQVILHPQGHRLPEGMAAMGIVREDGSVAISIYGDGTGVPPGQYVATLHWFSRGGQDSTPGNNLLPPRYSSAGTSPIEVVVEETSNQIPTIVVNSK